MARPAHINSLKRTLAQAIFLTESLGSLRDCKFTHEQQAALAHAESTLEPLTHPDYLARIVIKRNKLERRKRWQKRRHDNAIKRQKQATKRRQKLNEDLDRWQTETAAQETLRKTQKKKKMNKPNAAADLSQLVALLEDLRNLRRKKLEAQGHFFPQTGDDFYNKIKTREEQGEPQDAIEEEDDDGEMGQSLYIHPEDTTSSLDQTAYRFWAQGLQTPKALLQIRNHWDMFLDESEGTRIPPTWVAPAPPSSWIWASYLDLH